MGELRKFNEDDVERLNDIASVCISIEEVKNEFEDSTGIEISLSSVSRHLTEDSKRDILNNRRYVKRSEDYYEECPDFYDEILQRLGRKISCGILDNIEKNRIIKVIRDLEFLKKIPSWTRRAESVNLTEGAIRYRVRKSLKKDELEKVREDINNRKMC